MRPRKIAALLVILAGLILPPVAFAASSVSSQDFDLACAIATGAEMASNPPNSEKRGAAFTLLVFYLGRMSGRDDTTDWNKVALGRVAELKEKERSDELFTSCMNFYISKIQQ
jgi:hypothetical protein